MLSRKGKFLPESRKSNSLIQSQFEELKNDIKDIMITFLAPLLEVYRKVDEKLNKMQEAITKNNHDIITLRKKLDELEGCRIAMVANASSN